MTKIAIVVSAIVIFGLGIFIGYGLHTSPPPVNIPDIEKNALNNLEQKLNSKIQDDLIPFFERARITGTFLSGEISATDVQANTIAIQVKNNYDGGNFFGYLDEPNFYIKTIKIDSETKIVKQERKDMGEYIKERDEYIKNQTGDMPFPYKETDISIEDLEKNMSVSVESESEITLEGNDIIQAKKIIVNAPTK